MNCTFNNNNVPYSFGKDSCGGGKHLLINYRDIASICLNSSKTKNTQQNSFLKRLLHGVEKITETFIETYTIIITYYPTWHDKTKTNDKIISIASNEVEQARLVVDFVNNYIAELSKQKKINDAKIEQAKQTDTVDVVDENGKIEKVWKRQTFFGDTVLTAEGGNAYHTHADCFESWLDSYKSAFKGWKKISLANAKEQGYTLCKLCEKYYDLGEDEE